MKEEKEKSALSQILDSAPESQAQFKKFAEPALTALNKLGFGADGGQNVWLAIDDSRFNSYPAQNWIGFLRRSGEKFTIHAEVYLQDEGEDPYPVTSLYIMGAKLGRTAVEKFSIEYIYPDEIPRFQEFGERLKLMLSLSQAEK